MSWIRKNWGPQFILDAEEAIQQTVRDFPTLMLKMTHLFYTRCVNIVTS